MESKLKNLLSEITTLSEEDVKTLFLEVSQLPAINASLLAKIQELLANTFEDAKTTTTNFLQPPRRSARLSIKISISTQIEAIESSKKDGVSSEHVDKIDNNVDYTLESSIKKNKNKKHTYIENPLQLK